MSDQTTSIGTTKLTTIMKGIRKATKKHTPEILMGIGIAGMVTTTVLAVRATPKALMLISERESEDEEAYPSLTPLEKVKVVWPCYAPATIVGVLSITCLICSSSVNARRNAALATAYALSESTLKEYQTKVIEEIGEKKEKAVRDAIDKDKIEQKPVSTSNVILTEKGNTLCFEKLSGRYFKSDIEKLKKAVNELNRQMRYDMYVSLNEFYYAIGLDGTEIGDMLGWNIDKGYIDLDFSSQLTDEGTPCLVIGYTVLPQYEFN